MNLSGFYSNMEASNINYNYMYWGNNELQNNTPTSYTVVNNTLVAATWPGTQPVLPVGEYWNSGHTVSPEASIIDDNITRPGASSQSYYVNFDGKFEVSDKLTFKTQVGFTHGIGQTLSAPSFEVLGATSGLSYAPSGNGWAVSPVAGNGYVGPQSPAGLAAGWVWNERFISVDKETYAKVDGQWDVDNGAIKAVKFGARIADHSRQTDGWDRGCSLGADGNCWTSPAMPFTAVDPTSYPSGFNAGALGVPGLLIPLGANPGSVAAVLNAITDRRPRADLAHRPAGQLLLAGSFKVSEVDTEAYAMANVGGDGWRGNFGVRLANTVEQPRNNVSDPTVGHRTIPATSSPRRSAPTMWPPRPTPTSTSCRA